VTRRRRLPLARDGKLKPGRRWTGHTGMDSVRALYRRLWSSSDMASSSQPPPSAGDEETAFPPQSPGMISLARFLLSELPALSSARPTPAPELALEPASPRPEEDCPICLAPLDEGCSRTPCLHVFHQKCLETYFIAARESPGARGKCPICRGPIHAPLPVEARAMSGRPIDVISQIRPGARCHFDRHYAFRSLGGFEQPGMLYVITSNDDRKVRPSGGEGVGRCVWGGTEPAPCREAFAKRVRKRRSSAPPTRTADTDDRGHVGARVQVSRRGPPQLPQRRPPRRHNGQPGTRGLALD
jgi:hypothetical protein